MNTIKKIILALMVGSLGVLINFKVAHAADVETSTDDFTTSVIFDYSSEGVTQTRTTAYSHLTRSELRAAQSKIGSGFDSAIQACQDYAVNSSRVPLSDVVFNSVNYGNAYPVSIKNFDFGIDYTLPELEGYYTVSYDIYIGISPFFWRGTRDNTVTNIFTYDPSSYVWEDQDGHVFSIIFIEDSPEISFTSGTTTQKGENFIHLRAYYVGTHAGETLSCHLLEYFNTHITAWSAQGVYGNGYQIAAYMLQAFFIPEVSYLSEAPATPTPSPTPYPGQDIQESINQGVNIIVNALDVSATPIPHPEEITLDPTIFDELETATLPDVSPALPTFSSLWSIFDPLWAYIGMLIGSLLVVGIFLYCLKGNFI